jgi:hypothetical protein
MSEAQDPPAHTTMEDLRRLNSELESVMMTFNEYHSQMVLYREFYKKSAFYQRQAGDAPTKDRKQRNFLKTFARKNILYTSAFPLLKVPTTGADEMSRKAAAMREKILYGVHRKSGTPLLQKKWANDATVESVAVAETGFDLKARCAYVRRYNPRYCYWQISNDNEPRVVAFWAVFPITGDEAFRRYGVRPTTDLLFGQDSMQLDNHLKHIDGHDWFTMAIRWDETTRTKWIGNVIAEAPHNHLMGGVPIDVCMPFDDGEQNGQFGSFYLSDLVPLQAELNDVVQRRNNVIRRMGDPAVWGAGVNSKQFDEFNRALGSGQGGGFLGLSKEGRAGILQLQETAMFDNAKNDIIADMQRLAGFSAATFGETVGANTSGDALGMYFTPTQKLIDDENISWIAFYESINAKILRLYERFALPTDTFNFSGYAPTGTLLPITDKDGHKRMYAQAAAFSEQITGEDIPLIIGGNHNSVVKPRAVTPKNELEEKRLVMEAVNNGFLSHTTGYEMWELESPEEEFALLEQEQLNPAINPDGVNSLLSGFGAAAGGQPAAAPPVKV